MKELSSEIEEFQVKMHKVEEESHNIDQSRLEYELEIESYKKNRGKTH